MRVEGTRISDEKIKTIKEFSVSGSLRSMRVFYGVPNFFRIYIQNFSTIARPIT